MQEITIKKVEVGEKFVTVSYSKEESRQGVTDNVTTNRKFPFNIHDELKEALKDLVPHFAMCTESVKDIDGLVAAYEVTGFEIKRSGDNNGVTIFGHRKLKDGRVVKFTTPFINFDIEISEYVYIKDLIKAVDIAKGEAVEYVNGKFKVGGTQLSFGDKPEEKPVKKLSGKAKDESKAA